MLKALLRRLAPGPLRRLVQRRKLDRLVRNYPRRVVSHVYAGTPLRVELADGLGEGWYDHDWGPLPELDVLASSRLKPGARVFDLGAHQGVVGMILGRRVGPSGQVVLVEGTPHNVEMCRRNAALNAMPWLTPHHAAVGDQVGEMQFAAGWNGQAGELGDYGGLVTVPAITIDALAERYGRPDVAQVDIEGFEGRALAAATATLAGPTDWSVEVHLGHGLEKAGGSAEQILSYFPPARFELFVHDDGDPAALPLAETPPERLRRRFFLTALAR